MIESNTSLIKLSKDAHIPYKTLSNYLKNIYNPSLKSVIKLADYFNCNIDYLVGLTDKKQERKYSKPDKLFLERYYDLLHKRNVSHYRLTKDTDININVLQKWKKGALPSLNNLITIADYLGSSIDYLIGRKPIN